MKKTGLFTALLLLAACNGNSWWGTDDSEKLSGERVALLKLDSNLRKSSSLDEVAVRLPYPEVNKQWRKSSGFDVALPLNPQAPWTIEEQTTVDLGEGGSEYYHLTASPVIAENKIFLMDGDGLVTALNAGDIEKKLWKTHIKFPKGEGNFTSGGLTYENGMLYIATGHNVVMALSAKDGQEMWRRSLSSIARSAPAVYGGRVFVNTLGNQLYALDAEDGALLWSHEGIEEDVGIFGNASPVAFNDLVVVSYSSGELYALDVATGRMRWSDSLALGNTNAAYALSDIDASPVIAGGNIFAISNSGVLASLELFSGIRGWERELSGTEAPWVGGQFLFALGEDGKVVAIQTSSGAIKWVQELPQYENPEKHKGRITWSGPVLAGSRVLVVSSDGQLVSLSPLDGRILDNTEVSEDIYVAPVVAYSTIYLWNNDAKLTELKGLVKQVSAEDLEGRAIKHEAAGKAKEPASEEGAEASAKEPKQGAISNFKEWMKEKIHGNITNPLEDDE